MNDHPRTSAAMQDFIVRQLPVEDAFKQLGHHAILLERELADVRAINAEATAALDAANKRTEEQRGKIGDLTHELTMARSARL